MDSFESRMNPRFLAESDERKVGRAKSNRIREGNGGKVSRKKKKAGWGVGGGGVWEGAGRRTSVSSSLSLS